VVSTGERAALPLRSLVSNYQAESLAHLRGDPPGTLWRAALFQAGTAALGTNVNCDSCACPGRRHNFKTAH